MGRAMRTLGTPEQRKALLIIRDFRGIVKRATHAGQLLAVGNSLLTTFQCRTGSGPFVRRR